MTRAISSGLTVISFKAGEALTSDQYKIMKMSGESVIKSTAATDNHVGILQDAPANGAAASVAIAGVSKIIMGESSLSTGAILTATTSATAEQLDAASEVSIGTLRQTADSTETGSCVINIYQSDASDA
tara:strand:- start:1815 stop:2201 length:387 start_codon:yes stop_codon:yes gene_type:complete